MPTGNPRGKSQRGHLSNTTWLSPWHDDALIWKLFVIYDLLFGYLSNTTRLGITYFKVCGLRPLSFDHLFSIIWSYIQHQHVIYHLLFFFHLSFIIHYLSLGYLSFINLSFIQHHLTFTFTWAGTDIAMGDNPFFTWMNIFFEWIIWDWFEWINSLNE